MLQTTSASTEIWLDLATCPAWKLDMLSLLMLKRLERHWKKIAVVAVVLIAMIVEALVLTADHWWKKLAEARVTYKGQPSSSSRVYLSHDDDLLIFLAEEGEGSLYIVYPGNNLVGMPSRPDFYFFPGYAYCRNVPPLIALMQSAKIEVDPQLIIQAHLIEFNSFEKARVRVTW